jgi:hypothetical protein
VKLIKELETAKIEKAVVSNQLEAATTQRDENKRMYETLLGVINAQKQTGNIPSGVKAIAQS